MSEKTEGQDTGAEAVAGGVDPVAVALALDAAKDNPKLAAAIEAYLNDQRALIADQRHHLHEQFKHLHLSVWEKQLGVLLRVATAVVGIAAAASVAFLIWDAAHANGVSIEAFSVPPEMAARGLTGQAVAGQMLDNLNAMQANTGSYRSLKSYASNWGNDIKVEIPETGMSVGELYRFLRGWLGHDTTIGGEIYRTKDGIAITARAGGEGVTFSGPETDLNALLQKAAESLYSRTELYRYAGFLRTRRRFDEARPIYEQLTQDASPRERAWAWDGLSTLALRVGDMDRVDAAAHRAVAVYPDFSFGWYFLASTEDTSDRAELELAARRKAEQLLGSDSVPDVVPQSVPSMRLYNSIMLASLQGDFAAAETLGRSSEDIAIIDGNVGREGMHAVTASALALGHDGSALAQYFQGLPAPRSGIANAAASPVERRAAMFALAGAISDYELEKWQAVLAGLPAVEAWGMRSQLPNPEPFLNHHVRPLAALAKAHLGDREGAEGLIGQTPADCFDCVRTRGTIASVFKEWGRANYWFARAVQQAPSIPFAYADWGQAWLARGKPDQAIAQFTIANEKGPHFADPLEMWGEALMAKNQSHLALAKFAEADRYAPNWGRLHLKWGEALSYAGKKDEAAKEFTRAAQLDLTPYEKAELGRLNSNRVLQQ